MKPKTLILMVVAVTCGLGASYMTSRLLAQRGQSDENETVAVWVAAKNIDQGTLLKKAEDLFEAKEFLRGSEPKDGIQKIEDIKGKILKRPLRAGDPVRGDDVLRPEEAGMQYILPAGHLAIGVRVNQSSSAGGWATLPLNRVDVFSTVRRGDDNSSYCQVLLEDILVLAVDTNASRDEQGRAMPGNTAILALKPEDVLKVEMAKEMGPLSLALRKYGDKVKYDAGKISVTQLITKQDKKDEEVGRTGEPPVAKSALPDLPKTEAKPAAVTVHEDPHSVHTLVITEGEHQKRVQYYLDEKGDVIPREVSKTEVPRVTPPSTPPGVSPPSTPPSTPPSVAPPSLTPPTPSVGKKD